ncbi:MAG: HEAT repeat domain-containing protein [Planctomycetota bacterium]|nr:MAG: HEAT repeat domain-containing protein [Planctomycetota bacterium]REJ90000.1 MAG: HEAT repeat domain-containing protein [Planctomycetota bacterium]REK28232.1 MAG: HEAT repeat domain-containing protein [Planctomycetota bacterium]REK39756.1 MAG: HEAT repeat domain-containing protein [Planctomycetota bacterium]
MSDVEPQRSNPEVLPEVQPPTTGFILQLFVIPGLIVVVIVLVWLLIGSMAESGSDPAKFLVEIKRGRSNSWQQALSLAQTLQSDPKLKYDRQLAGQIADYLDSLLDLSLPQSPEDLGQNPGTTRDEKAEGANLRRYLCMALGNFRVDEGLPVLLKAAGMEDGGDEEILKVRVAALMAIANLAENFNNLTPPQTLDHPNLLPTLLAASQDDQVALRSPSAIALGVLGTEAALERLEDMLIEAQPANVHYNVATSLARNGRESSTELLLEMLQPARIRELPKAPPKNERVVLSERQIQQRDAEQRRLEQALVVRSALQALPQLQAANPEADLQPLMAALAALRDSDLPKSVRLEAERLLNEFKARASESQAE